MTSVMIVLRRSLDALQRHQSAVVAVASALLAWLILRWVGRDSNSRRPRKASKKRARSGESHPRKPQTAPAPQPTTAPTSPLTLKSGPLLSASFSPKSGPLLSTSSAPPAPDSPAAKDAADDGPYIWR